METMIVYGNEYLCAKEITVFPGKSITMKYESAYGCVIVYGYGTFGQYKCSAAHMLRFKQLSEDEFFVSADEVRNGVKVHYTSDYESYTTLI